MADKPPVIGETKCRECGAKVLAKRNAANRIYMTCNGEADDRQCGTQVVLGYAKSREFVAAIAKAKAAMAEATKPKSQGKAAAKEAKADGGTTRNDDREPAPRSYL
jgi:hypothetical protein